MEPLTKEQYDQALAIVVDAHQKFLDLEPDGIRLDLSGVNLTHVKLNGACLNRAHMIGASLQFADLTGAKFDLTKLPDDTFRNLPGEQLNKLVTGVLDYTRREGRRPWFSEEKQNETRD
jgi:hypothetical protein